MRFPSSPRSERVLLSCGASGWGGLEGEVLLLAEAYRRRGLATALLVQPETPLALRAQEAGFDCHPCLPLRRADAAGSVLALARDLRRMRPSFLHVHEGRDLRVLVPALAMARTGSALYVTRHMGLRHARRDPWHRWIYGRVRRFYAISHHVAEEARRVLPLPPERVIVRPPGIDTGRFDPARVDRAEVRARLGWAPSDLVIGMLGRVTAHKGQPDLLEAASLLLPVHPRLRFSFVGSAGRDASEHALEAELLRRARTLGPRVSWHPATERPEEFYAAFDVFVFPSHIEAFGLALVEAMAMRRPVIAAAAAGVLDIVTDGRDGLLYSPGSAAELADRITGLVDHPEMGASLGTRAREKVLGNWDINRIAELYIEDFYNDTRYNAESD